MSGSVRAQRRGKASAVEETAIADVESLTHDARGVARINGKTTFIEGALPGEQVRFRYLSRRARYDSGVLVEVIKPSPSRAEPPCPHYGVCGGCSLQHLAPSAQVLAKQQVLAETLQHIGRVQPEQWLAPLQGPASGYRRRARLGARLVPKKGGVLVGFREKRSSYITPLERCETLDPRLAALLVPLRDVIGGLSCADRVPQVEVSAGEAGCTAVFRHLAALTESDRERLMAFARNSGVTVYVQPGAIDTVQPLWPNPAPALYYDLPDYGVRLQFEPTDFVQVNAAVNRALIAQALALLDVQASDRVVDLFCGLGNFTLPLARRVAHVTGYEADAGLIARARANAERNGIANAEFRVANLYEAGESATWYEQRPEKLLLDPPRAGAMEAIKAIGADGPQRIVYVSCNPATLARDSEYLVHVLGYRLAAAGIADMFPHTSHVESLALFVRP